MARRPLRVSTRLAALETQAARLLAAAGQVATVHDSARLSAALGHLAQARQELQQARMVAAATECRERAQ